MTQRIHDDAGYLTDLHVTGDIHLSRTDGRRRGRRWSLSCIKPDGTEVVVSIAGKVTLVNELPPRGQTDR